MTRGVWLRVVASAVLLTVVLSCVFARPTWSAPVFAAQTFALAPQEWTSPSGSIVLREDGVRVESKDTSGTAVLLREPLQLAAAKVRYLHVRARDVAPDARLVLMWRGSGEMQRRVLPRVWRGGVIDLTAMPGWDGDIQMLGIVALPIDYLAAEAVTRQAFVLESAELRTDNWASAFSAMSTQWLAPRPWSGASINSAGNEFGAPGASLTLFVACWIAAMALVLVGLLGRLRAQRVLPALMIAGSLLLVLDAGRDLLGRTAAVRAAAARVSEFPQLPLAADPQLAGEVERLREALEALPPARVLVYGSDAFQRDYSVYLLRTFPVTALWPGQGGALGSHVDGTVLVMAGQGDWQFDAESGRLMLEGVVFIAASVWEGPRLHAFRLASVEPTP